MARTQTPGKEPPAISVPVAQTIDALRQAVHTAKSAGKTVGFVPTMGALHHGHTSLIERARQDCGFVVVSIFVNPTQFASQGEAADYPRNTDADLELCRKCGTDLVFQPGVEEMYPPGDETRVRPGPLADTLCGPFRPGHFEGVCTVVCKLFNIVQPDVAYFGQKDAQQAVIVRRMVAGLRMSVRIVVCETIREADGLAASSRNAGLSGERRRQAVCLYTSLCVGRDLLQAGERTVGQVIAAMKEVIEQSGPEKVAVEYLSIVDPDTLEGVREPRGRVLIAVAVRIGGVRLIDNLIVDLA